MNKPTKWSVVSRRLVVSLVGFLFLVVPVGDAFATHGVTITWVNNGNAPFLLDSYKTINPLGRLMMSVRASKGYDGQGTIHMTCKMAPNVSRVREFRWTAYNPGIGQPRVWLTSEGLSTGDAGFAVNESRHLRFSKNIIVEIKRVDDMAGSNGEWWKHFFVYVARLSTSC